MKKSFNMHRYFNSRKFIVSLDAVDTSLISCNNTIGKETDNCKPLWSAENLNLRNEKCYYQIDVQDNYDVVDEFSAAGGYVTLDTYKCHICNLDVPQYYKQEHVNSSKHKMLMEFAQVAVDRLIKSIEQCSPKRNPISSLYFCDVCVCVVSLKDKSRHLSSENHRNAVQKDAMIEKLFKLYTDNDVIFDDLFPYNREEVDTEHELNSKSSESNTKLPTTETATPQPEFNSDDYLKILNTKTKSSHTLISIDDEHYQIILNNGCEVKIEQNNFHGIKRVLERHYQCKLCSDVFRNRECHIQSAKHVEKVSLPLKDEHCVRDINEFKSHCILCNELIDSYLVHTMCNMNHTERLNEYVSIPEENIETTDVSKAQAKVEAEVDTKLSKKVDVRADDKTKPEAKAWCKLCKVTHFHNDRRHVNCKEDSEVIKQTLESLAQTGYYVCDVCFMRLRSHQVENHIFDTDHIDRWQKMLNDNIYVDNGEKMYCDLCGVLIERDREVANLLNMRYVPRTQRQIAEVDNDVGISTTASEDNGHKSNNVQVIKKDEVQKTNEHVCKICNVKVPNNIHNITDHENGAKHKKMLSTYKCDSDIQTQTTPSIVSDVAKTVEIKPAKNEMKKELEKKVSSADGIEVREDKEQVASTSLQTEKKLIKTQQPNQNVVVSTKHNFPIKLVENKASCEICDIAIPYKENNILEHLYGQKHLKSIKKCKDNGLIITDNKFYCQLCCIYVMTEMKDTHIGNEAHKENFEEYQKMSVGK